MLGRFFLSSLLKSVLRLFDGERGEKILLGLNDDALVFCLTKGSGAGKKDWKKKTGGGHF